MHKTASGTFAFLLSPSFILTSARGENLQGPLVSPITISNQKKLVFSPHCYGPSVASQPYFSVCCARSFFFPFPYFIFILLFSFSSLLFSSLLFSFFLHSHIIFFTRTRLSRRTCLQFGTPTGEQLIRRQVPSYLIPSIYSLPIAPLSPLPSLF